MTLGDKFVGFRHILEHYGDNRKDVYRRIFQILWFGCHLGKEDVSSGTPTYVYPDDLLQAVRSRFPDSEAGRRDAEYAERENVFRVTWSHIQSAKWPNPPKSCRTCNVSARKPY